MCQLRNHRKSTGTSQLQVLYRLRVLFPSFGDYEWEKSDLKSMVTEQEFNTTMRTLGTVPLEISS